MFCFSGVFFWWEVYVYQFRYRRGPSVLLRYLRPRCHRLGKREAVALRVCLDCVPVTDADVTRCTTALMTVWKELM